MKHPFWIINISLLLILCLSGLLIFFMTPKTPHLISLVIPEISKLQKKEFVKIDPNKIYINDLFDTYKPPLTDISQEEVKKTIKPMPLPPKPRFFSMPIKKIPQFLEPLKISLKGIIVGSDEYLNRAIIEKNQEKTTLNYKIGDRIEDARLIRILKNKVIFVRSNGQQEALYINPKDAQIDAEMLPFFDWSSIIIKIDETHFSVDREAFVEKIVNLPKFIEYLDLTTVYKKGKNIGCRVGNSKKDSLAQALGLMPGDIIVSINNIETTSTKSRIALIDHISSLQEGDSLEISLLRKKIPQTYYYQLKKNQDTLDQHNTAKNTRRSASKNATDKGLGQKSVVRNMFNERHKYEKIAAGLEKQEKEYMSSLDNTYRKKMVY